MSAPWTLKRAAWAYGCAKKGSAEEARLHRTLMDTAAREPQGTSLRVVGNVLSADHPMKYLYAHDTLTLRFGDGRIIRLLLLPGHEVVVDTAKHDLDLPPLPDRSAT